MGWEIELGSKAQKFIENAEHSIASRIIDKLKELKENPFRFLERHEGNYYKLRIGDYRALIDIDFEKKVLIVAVLDKQGRIYK